MRKKSCESPGDPKGIRREEVGTGARGRQRSGGTTEDEMVSLQQRSSFKSNSCPSKYSNTNLHSHSPGWPTWALLLTSASVTSHLWPHHCLSPTQKPAPDWLQEVVNCDRSIQEGGGWEEIPGSKIYKYIHEKQFIIICKKYVMWRLHPVLCWKCSLKKTQGCSCLRNNWFQEEVLRMHSS